MNLQLHNGESIELASKAFASGGEGDLYHILRPAKHRKSVVKFYKTTYQTIERSRKIDYLIRHAPSLHVYKGHHSLIWAQQKVFDKTGKFVGFMMPIAEGISLEKLCHPKIPSNLPTVWQKFDFKQKDAIKLRLKICFNIAAALYQVHQLQRYVLVDMKPENILIKPNGLISIIDIDSVEIVEKKRVLFAAPVATPDYTPSEYTNNNSSKTIAKTLHGDAFSLAVIFYRLLMGIHPFTGTCKPPYDRLETLAEMIEKGLYPHSPKWQNYFEVVPPPHQKFHKLPTDVKRLFLQCFEVGFTAPQLRPSADDWCKTLATNQKKVPATPLPSSLISLPKWTPNQPLSLKIPNIELPKIDFRQLQLLQIRPKRLSYNEKILRQRIERNYQQQIQYLKGMLHNLQNYYKEYDKIEQAFVLKQNQLLKDEQLTFDKLVQTFEKQALQSDKNGQQLAEKEETERQKYHIHFMQKANELLQKMQWQQLMYQALQQRNTSLLQQQLQKMKSHGQHQVQSIEVELQQEITFLHNDLQEQKSRQLKQLDEQLRKKLKQLQQKQKKLQKNQTAALAIASQTHLHPITRQWLKGYTIKLHAHQIFAVKPHTKNVLVNQLSRFGINNAADFTQVKSNGEIMNSNGKWVKVPKVGLKRAKNLEHWRNRLLKQMPLQKILPNKGQSEVQRKFAPQFRSIEQSIAQERKQNQQKRQNLLNNFDRKQQTLQQKIERLKKKAEKDKTQVQQKTEKEVNLLREQFQRLAKMYTTQPQKVVQQINKNIERYKKERVKNQEASRKKQQTIGTKFQRDRKNQVLQLKNLSQLSERDIQKLKQKFYQKLQQNLQQHYSKMEYAKSHQEQLKDLIQKKLFEIQKLKRILEG